MRVEAEVVYMPGQEGVVHKYGGYLHGMQMMARLAML